MNMYRYWRNVVKFLFRDSFTFYGGGSPGAPAMTSQNVTTSNIPEYMKPYAKAMLGGAMEQAFNVDSRGNITGPKQYIPYGVDPGLFDATTSAQQAADTANAALGNWGKGRQKADPKGYAAAQERANQANAALAAAQGAQQQAIQQAYMPYEQGQTYSETGPSAFQGNAAVAGFSPMQMQAFKAAQGLQLPGQFAEGSDLVRQAAQGSLGIAGQAQQIGGAALGYGSQAAGYGAKAADIGMKALEYGDIASRTGLEGYQRAVRDAAEAARLSDIYGTQGSQYGQLGAEYGQLGTQYGAQGAGYGATAADMARMGYESQRAYEQKATSPETVQAFMNPYVQASLDPQLKLLAQQTGIQGAAQQAAATSAGAFGGSRSALQNALNQQAGNFAAQQAIGQGYNQAYDQAIKSMQYGAGLGIQGLQAGTQAQQAGIQGAGMGIQGAQAGIQGAQTGISGAQAGLQGVGQRLGAGQLSLGGAQTGIQGQQVGIQGVQAAMQGQGMGIQGAQAGIQGTQAATGAGQLGLGAYGQVGAQGVNLANIGNQQLAAEQGIIGLQSQMGGMQQQQQQNIINQAMQDYNTAQQYPYQQLGFINSLMRGIPQQSTQMQYQAAPNPWSQVAGLGIAGLGMYNAMGSDERLKENIEKVGALPNGISLYEFEYKPEFKDTYGEGRYRGVMAQDVEKIIPEAIVTMPDGYMGVNYDMVGTWMEAL